MCTFIGYLSEIIVFFATKNMTAALNEYYNQGKMGLDYDAIIMVDYKE